MTWPPPRRVAILIPCKNGAATIGTTIAAARTQGDVYLVSDGSDDDTVNTAWIAGAFNVMEIKGESIGKPNALREAFDHFNLHLYDAVLVLDDDTILTECFVAKCLAKLEPDVAAVAGEIRSLRQRETRWNWLVNGRALAYWRYGIFTKRGQAVLGVVNVLPGSNTLFATDVFDELVHQEVDLIVDDTQWTLEIQTRRLGKIVYVPSAIALIQDPTTLPDFYKQYLRWIGGTFQGIRKYKIGRRRGWFSLAYLFQMFDWLLYILLWPVLSIVLAWFAIDAGRGLAFAAVYFGGYAVWATIGAIATRRWRMIPLFPSLFVFDQLNRIIFVHAFVWAWRHPRTPCIWVSPERVGTDGKA